jgi:putative transposase
MHSNPVRPDQRAREDERISELIRQLHEHSRGTYGAPRMRVALRRRGVSVSQKRVARLMRKAGVSGLVKPRRGKTTIRVRGIATAPDLVRRDWNPQRPNQLWVGDITFVRTWEGWLYLAAGLDWFSRRCVGWSLRDDLRLELVVEALEMAVARRKPPLGLVHHSRDRSTSRLPSTSAARKPASISRWARRGRRSTTLSASRSSRRSSASS